MTEQHRGVYIEPKNSEPVEPKPRPDLVGPARVVIAAANARFPEGRVIPENRIMWEKHKVTHFPARKELELETTPDTEENTRVYHLESTQGDLFVDGYIVDRYGNPVRQIDFVVRVNAGKITDDELAERLGNEYYVLERKITPTMVNSLTKDIEEAQVVPESRYTAVNERWRAKHDITRTSNQEVTQYRGHQEELPLTTRVQSEVNELFRSSGLANRVLDSLHNCTVIFINYTYLTNEVSRCNFGVIRKPKETNAGLDFDNMATFVVIEFTNPEFARYDYRISREFKVEAGEGFGYKRRDALWERIDGKPSFVKDERPLTEKQMEAIEQALKLQEEEIPATGQGSPTTSATQL